MSREGYKALVQSAGEIWDGAADPYDLDGFQDLRGAIRERMTRLQDELDHWQSIVDRMSAAEASLRNANGGRPGATGKQSLIAGVSVNRAQGPIPSRGRDAVSDERQPTASHRLEYIQRLGRNRLRLARTQLAVYDDFLAHPDEPARPTTAIAASLGRDYSDDALGKALRSLREAGLIGKTDPRGGRVASWWLPAEASEKEA